MTTAFSPRRRAAAPPAAASLALGLSAASASAQPSGGFDPIGRAREALAEPFVGVTTDGAPRADLYRIAPTGISTAPVAEAARDLLAALDPEQREAIRFPIDDVAWRHWANIHRFPREGVSLAAMTTAQREARLRPPARLAQRQELRDLPRHHAAQPPPRRAGVELRRVRRAPLLVRRLRRALGRGTLGLAN